MGVIGGNRGALGQRRGPLARMALVLVVVLVLAGCTSDSPTSGSSSGAPTDSATESASTAGPNASGCAEPTRAAGIYYAADVADQGPRLYREFARVATCEDPIAESVAHMLGVPPVDPDYESLWEPGTEVLAVATKGKTATVDLSAFPALGAAFEDAAVQQLVWTVTAADTSVKEVRLLVNGDVPDSGHQDWSAPVARANALQTLANVWIVAPTQGATSGSPVQVSVYGTGYEGNVPIAVFQGDVEVESTFLTTMQGGFAEASTEISLPAGDYTVRAYNDSGRDPGLTLWDSKDFSVS